MAALTLVCSAALAQGGTPGEPTPPEVISMPLPTSEVVQLAISEGGRFSVGPGVFEFPEGLVIDSDLLLVGAGTEATVLELHGAPTAIRLAPGVHLELQNLTVRYVGAEPADVIAVNGASLSLQSVMVVGGAYGADPSGAKRFGLGSGIVAWNGATVSVVDSELTRHGITAFELYGASVVKLQRGAVSDNAVGFYAEDAVTLEVLEVTVEDNEFGALQARDDATVLLEGSVVRSNGRAHRPGVDPNLRSDALRVTGAATLRLVGNRILNNERHAISTADNARLHTSRNFFEGNGGEYEAEDYLISPVLLAGESRLESVDDVFQRNPGGSIELAEASSALLDRVIIRENALWSHMYLSGTAVLDIVNAGIVGNEGAIFIGSSARLNMRNSRVVATTDQDAIIVEDAGQVSLLSNTFEGNAYAGVSFAGAAGGVVAFNTFTGNLAGIVIMDEAAPELNDNQMQGNGDDVLRL